MPVLVLVPDRSPGGLEPRLLARVLQASSLFLILLSISDIGKDNLNPPHELLFEPSRERINEALAEGLLPVVVDRAEVWRGLDPPPAFSFLILTDTPQQASDYLHFSGYYNEWYRSPDATLLITARRVGRMGRTAKVITLCETRGLRRLEGMVRPLSIQFENSKKV